MKLFKDILQENATPRVEESHSGETCFHFFLSRDQVKRPSNIKSEMLN